MAVGSLEEYPGNNRRAFCSWQRTQRILCETTWTSTTKTKGGVKVSYSKDEEVFKIVQQFTTFIFSFFCMHKRYMS